MERSGESGAVGPHLLQDGDDGRLPLLQEVEHHQDVGIGRETSSGRVSDVAALCENRP